MCTSPTIALPVSLATALACTVLCVSMPAGAVERSGSHAVVSVLEVNVDEANRAEAEYWYSRMVAALDSLSGISTRKDHVPVATDLPHDDYERDLAAVERTHAASWSTLRTGDWMASVRLSEEALTLASKFGSPPLPGKLRRDLYLVQSRALLKGKRHDDAADALRSAMSVDPYWQPAPRCIDGNFRDLFDRLHKSSIDAPSGTLAVVTRHRDTQVMVHGVSQGWVHRRQFSMALPAGQYEVTSRRPGFADRTDKVTIEADRRTALRVKLRKGSSSAFYPDLMHALSRPGNQHESSIWQELESARAALGSDSILAARYGDGTGNFDGLVVGLYLPGRDGWSFYRRIPLSHDLAQDLLLVEKLSSELMMAVEQRLSRKGLARR